MTDAERKPVYLSYDYRAKPTAVNASEAVMSNRAHNIARTASSVWLR